MSIVTDAPTVHDWPVLAHGHQKFGHFVLLRLDALATVAILDDDEVSSAAVHLPQDWFLGIVLNAANLERVNDRGQPLLDLDIYLVGVGPPEPLSAAIPIAPATQISDDHPPIQVPFELPWPNLYSHSYLNIVAVISRIHAGPGYFPDPLTDEQQHTLLQMASKDQYHRYDAAFEELLKKAAQQPARSDTEGSGIGSDCESGSGSYDDFMLSDEAQLITAKYQRRHLCVELWLNPASCPGQPAPPSAFIEVAERLRDLMKEWYDRKLEDAKSRRPQLIKEWTQRVSKAVSGLDGQLVHARDLVLNDDDVLPEDAVDYRAEQRAREEGILDSPVPPMQLHSTPSTHEDGVTSFESARRDQHAYDDTSVPVPPAPPAADVKESPKSLGTVAGRRMAIVTESPTRHDWPVLAQGRQRFGHFVLLRLDSLASVAIFDDDEASRATVHLPQDWFLGIVTSTAGLEPLNERGRPPLLNLHIHLVGVGPSEPVSAAIPLSPAPQISDDHPPIQVPFALPWPNLYAHSYLTLSAVVTRIHAGPNYFQEPLSDEQLGALLEMASKDRYHRHDATFEALMKKLAEEQPDDPTPGDSDAGSDCGSDDDFMLSDEAQLITAKYERRHLCVELWLDPASCPGQPAPPAACTEVVNGLKEIMKGWYDRKLEEAKSRRPQLIKEWTQRVNEAASGLEEQLARARDSVLSDDDALPEDAVDHRVEQRAHEEDILNQPVSQMQPHSTAAMHEDGVIDIESARRDRHRHDSTSVPSPATPFPADVKASPKSPGTVASRLVSTKQIASKWLRAVIPRVKARLLHGA